MTTRSGAASAGKAVAVCLGALAWARPGAGETGPCELMASSRPNGATVSVDGKERGRTPLIVKGLSVGEHTVRIVLDGHRSWIKTIRFRPGPRMVSAKLEKLQGPVPPADGTPARGETRSAGPGGTKQGDGTPGEPARREPPEPTPDREVEPKKGRTPSHIRVPCPCCEGDGLVNKTGCPHCERDGYIGVDKCTFCDGNARKEYKCRACQGEGTVSWQGKKLPCRRCRGKGAPPCPACKGKGTVRRPNPEAAGSATTACAACGGEGYEQHLKCMHCWGRGRRTVEEGLYFRRIPCWMCGGSCQAAPMCKQCYGKGYVGGLKKAAGYSACMACGGTGLVFLPCKTCRGKGWHRSR